MYVHVYMGVGFVIGMKKRLLCLRFAFEQRLVHATWL